LDTSRRGGAALRSGGLWLVVGAVVFILAAVLIA
jgi:hypothetical protein